MTTRNDFSPEVRLIVAILARAGIDYLHGSLNATVFVWSADFNWYCEWIGVEPDRLRLRLEVAIRQIPAQAGLGVV